MDKGRMEAFSDGVIAIIITIMVTATITAIITTPMSTMALLVRN